MLDGMFEFYLIKLDFGGWVRISEPARGFDILAIPGFWFEGGGRAALFSTQFIVAGVGGGAQEPSAE